MNFALLKSLITVIESDQPRFFDQFKSFLSTEKYINLKQGLVNCHVEEDLVVNLYGSLNTGAYSKLKSRFTDQLLDIFLMSKTTKLSAYSGTLLSKYWQLTLLFKSMGHLELSKAFAIKGLKIAERKKKFKQAFKFADYLKSYHLLMRWDLRAFCKMEHKAADYLLLFNEEQHLKNIYFSLTFKLSVQRYPSYETPLFQSEDFENIQIPDRRSKHALFYYHSSIVLHAILDKSYDSAIRYIVSVEAQFEKNESKSWSRLLDNLKILKAQILLHKGQLDHALSILEELAPSKSVIESGRIIFLKSRVLLRLNRYQEAFDLFRIYYPRLNKIRNLDLPFVEGFYLMYGLFYVLYRYGRVHCEASYFKTFRYYKWLNSLPIYSKDKMGMNITILIIDFLIGKTEGWSSMYAKAEQLDLYRYRYFKNKEQYNSVRLLFRFFKEYAKHQMDKDIVDELKGRISKMGSSNSDQLPLYFSEIELLPWKAFGNLALEEKMNDDK